LTPVAIDFAARGAFADEAPCFAIPGAARVAAALAWERARRGDALRFARADLIGPPPSRNDAERSS
jgi:hypothetical protein